MCKLTVYFDDPWWVGIIEEEENSTLRVYRHVFGSEPSNAEVLNFILYDLDKLYRQSNQVIEVAQTPERYINPKRASREAAQQMRTHGVSTKAQEALRVQLEQNKQAHHEQSKEEREAAESYKRQKAREKALARKRGH